MQSGDELIEVEIDEVITTTGRAYLVSMSWIDDDFKIWLPKSKCDVYQNGRVINVPRWLLIAKAEELDLQDFYELAEA